MKKLRVLNLDQLLKLPCDERNEKVLNLNFEVLQDEYTFSEVYGGLCGNRDMGLLMEESQEMLFVCSEICQTYGSDESVIILMQDNKVYEAELIQGRDDEWLSLKHIDFSGLCLLC